MNLKHTAEKDNDKNYSPKNLYFFNNITQKFAVTSLIRFVHITVISN